MKTLIKKNLYYVNDFLPENAAKRNEGFGGRGLLLGGHQPSPAAFLDPVSYFSIGTLGNALDYGELTLARHTPASASDGVRAVAAGGISAPTEPPETTMDYVAVKTSGNAIDFGELAQGRGYLNGGASDGSRGVIGGGHCPADPYTNAMDYWPIGIPGTNATDFGNLAEASLAPGGTSGSGRGMWCNGWKPGNDDTLQYISIGVPAATASNFGETTQARHASGAGSTGYRGVVWAGQPVVDTIDYFTFLSLGNAVDFGETRFTGGYQSSSSDGNRGVWAMNSENLPSPEAGLLHYLTLSTTGNSVEFGYGDHLLSSLGASQGD